MTARREDAEAMARRAADKTGEPQWVFYSGKEQGWGFAARPGKWFNPANDFFWSARLKKRKKECAE